MKAGYTALGGIYMWDFACFLLLLLVQRWAWEAVTRCRENEFRTVALLGKSLKHGRLVGRDRRGIVDLRFEEEICHAADSSQFIVCISCVLHTIRGTKIPQGGHAEHVHVQQMVNIALPYLGFYHLPAVES